MKEAGKMIKTVTSLYFDGNDNGIILDDALLFYRQYCWLYDVYAV